MNQVFLFSLLYNPILKIVWVFWSIICQSKAEKVIKVRLDRFASLIPPQRCETYLNVPKCFDLHEIILVVRAQTKF